MHVQEREREIHSADPRHLPTNKARVYYVIIWIYATLLVSRALREIFQAHYRYFARLDRV